MTILFQIIIFLNILFIPFVGKAEIICAKDEYFVRGHYRKGYTRSDGVKVSESNVKAHCKALSKGYTYLNKLLQTGIPKNWPHKEKSADWTEAEKQRLIEAFENIPDILLSDRIIGIYRLKRSEFFPNPASSSNGVIVIYDSAFESSRGLERILSHELSHHNFFHQSEANKQGLSSRYWMAHGIRKGQENLLGGS